MQRLNSCMDDDEADIRLATVEALQQLMQSHNDIISGLFQLKFIYVHDDLQVNMHLH